MIGSMKHVEPVVGELNPYVSLSGVKMEGWFNFMLPTIAGLVRVTGTRIDILAVTSLPPGVGHFHTFMEELKHNYTTIAVWEIWNRALKVMLFKYGFRKVVEDLGDGDGKTEGMRWDAP